MRRTLGEAQPLGEVVNDNAGAVLDPDERVTGRLRKLGRGDRDDDPVDLDAVHLEAAQHGDQFVRQPENGDAVQEPSTMPVTQAEHARHADRLHGELAHCAEEQLGHRIQADDEDRLAARRGRKRRRTRATRPRAVT